MLVKLYLTKKIKMMQIWCKLTTMIMTVVRLYLLIIVIIITVIIVIKTWVVVKNVLTTKICWIINRLNASLSSFCGKCSMNSKIRIMVMAAINLHSPLLSKTLSLPGVFVSHCPFMCMVMSKSVRWVSQHGQSKHVHYAICMHVNSLSTIANNHNASNLLVNIKITIIIIIIIFTIIRKMYHCR